MGRGAGSQEATSSSSSTTGGDVPILPPATGNAPELKLGEVLRFDKLGPVIVNEDGTTRRITNWDNLTPQEKEVTMRRIGKRNKERIAKLQAAKDKEAQSKPSPLPFSSKDDL